MSDISPDDLDSVPNWYFAIGGLQTQSDTLELAQAIRLQRLKTFPTRTELITHLDNPLVAGLMQHYGEELVQHELVIDAENIDDPQFIPRTASAILAALRIRTQAEIICPAVSDRSWSDLRDADPNSCKAHRVESAMYSHEFEEPTIITIEDMDWTRENLGKLIELSEAVRFNTALEALCTYLHAANYRMMAAQLWAGVEAIFEVNYEISFRLPLLAALLLEERGPTCRALRIHIKTLYNERSKAVHGADIPEDVLKNHVTNVRSLLARLLAKIIEDGELPTKQDFDDLVVMPGRGEISSTIPQE